MSWTMAIAGKQRLNQKSFKTKKRKHGLVLIANTKVDNTNKPQRIDDGGTGSVY